MELKLKDGGTLYYEVHGKEGEWLVLLNGIMMNTVSWIDYIPVFSGKYRLLLIDFRDQFRSSKLESGYDASLHTGDLVQLFDFLNIRKINMFGVSYGGQVALDFTHNNQHRLKRLMLMSIGAKATNYLRAIGDAWDTAAKYKNGLDFFSLGMPFIYSDAFYENNLEWLNNRQKIFKDMLTDEWFESFLRLSQSAKNFDFTHQLENITVPTVLICGTHDIITPSYEMEKMAGKIKNCTMLTIPNAGHGAMLEKPRELITVINGFMQSDFG